MTSNVCRIVGSCVLCVVAFPGCGGERQEQATSGVRKESNGPSAQAPLYYLDHIIIITDGGIRLRSKQADATYQSELSKHSDVFGRTKAVQGTVTFSTEHTIKLDRSYAYQTDGSITVTDKSTVTHGPPEALTYKYDVTENVDIFGRTAAMNGKILASNGEIFHVRRKYDYKPDGSVSIRDTSTTAQDDPKATTYEYNLTEYIDIYGELKKITGSVTDSKGVRIEVNREY